MQQKQIEEVLARVVPHAYTHVREYDGIMAGRKYFGIFIAASDFNINRVQGQWPACVSLILYPETLELAPQVFGGNGGQCVFRLPDKENPSERHLVYSSVKIPFRKPKPEPDKVLAAIERFAIRWKEAIRDNLDRMPHTDSVDYEKAIS